MSKRAYYYQDLEQITPEQHKNLYHFFKKKDTFTHYHSYTITYNSINGKETNRNINIYDMFVQNVTGFTINLSITKIFDSETN